jgi:hypothetical protein
MKKVTIDDEGTMFHFLDGMLHNTNGPAIKNADGREEFYINGKKVTSKMIEETPPVRDLNPDTKYMREIKPNVWIDVYDVLTAFKTGCPALDHAIKKLLCPGKRGVKTSIQDKAEAIGSINRSIEIEKQTDSNRIIAKRKPK